MNSYTGNKASERIFAWKCAVETRNESLKIKADKMFLVSQHSLYYCLFRKIFFAAG